MPAAMKLTVAKFSRKARQLRERIHPETIRARRVKAAGDREFSFEPSRDGMAYLTLYTEAPLAMAIHDRVTAAAMAQQRPEEPRTLTQLRADVATELLLTGGGGADGGGPQEDRFAGIRPTVFVTVPVVTLLGHSDEPATLDGYGPIDPDTARRLTAQAPSLFRLLTDPETGELLALEQGLLPAPPPAAPIPAAAGRDLPVPRPQPQSRALRPRPHHRQRTRRPQHRRKPRPPLPQTPPTETPHRLERRATGPRRAPLDLTHRTPIHQRTRTAFRSGPIAGPRESRTERVVQPQPRPRARARARCIGVRGQIRTDKAARACG